MYERNFLRRGRYRSIILDSCDDGVKNQDETDVDCGGVCDACQTCSDGILNQDEINVDCGGSNCPACSKKILI